MPCINQRRSVLSPVSRLTPTLSSLVSRLSSLVDLQNWCPPSCLACQDPCSPTLSLNPTSVACRLSLSPETRRAWPPPELTPSHISSCGPRARKLGRVPCMRGSSTHSARSGLFLAQDPAIFRTRLIMSCTTLSGQAQSALAAQAWELSVPPNMALSYYDVVILVL